MKCQSIKLCVVLFCVSCSTDQQPDFDRLYQATTFESRRSQPDKQTTRPVIIIPGLFGSRLVDNTTGEEVWPGTVSSLLFSDYHELKIEIDPETLLPKPSNLIAKGITETAIGRDFYGRLINTLKKYGGYQLTEPNSPLEDHFERRLYVFDYDWRQDNVVTAGLLARFIEQIRSDFNNPALKVNIIAHSMGGLMARYFLRYGAADVLNDNQLKVTWSGAKSVHKMILLGTPNLGSVSAIEGFIRGQKVGLRRIPPEIVATMPATYQMFPHRIVDWLYTPTGQVMDQDQFDIETWRSLQWNIFSPSVLKDSTTDEQALFEQYFERNVERARRFSWSLTVCPNYTEGGCPEEIPDPPVRLVVFGGDCSLTTARLILEDPNDGLTIRFKPSQVKNRDPAIDYKKLMLDPGDGTVTKPSLLGRDALSPYTPRHAYSYFPLAYSFMLCESHATLTGNVHFEDNLLDVLLTKARPGELHQDHGFSRMQ